MCKYCESARVDTHVHVRERNVENQSPANLDSHWNRWTVSRSICIHAYSYTYVSDTGGLVLLVPGRYGTTHVGYKRKIDTRRESVPRSDLRRASRLIRRLLIISNFLEISQLRDLNLHYKWKCTRHTEHDTLALS